MVLHSNIFSFWPTYLHIKLISWKDFSSLSCPGLNRRGETTCWDVPNIWFGIIEEYQPHYYCWHFLAVLLLINFMAPTHNISQHLLLILIKQKTYSMTKNVPWVWYLLDSYCASYSVLRIRIQIKVESWIRIRILILNKLKRWKS